MKIINYIAGLIIVLTISSCNREDGTSTNTDNSTSYFKTQDEAVLKGKGDLLSILRSSSEIQLTINPELLEKAQPGISVKHLEIDFDQVLKQERISDLNQFRTDARSNINTLSVDKNVVTVIRTANSDKGWTVTGLADAAITNDLDEILSARDNTPIEGVILYEIPNIQAFIYSVKTSEGNKYFSKYNGYSLKEEVSIERLYPLLYNDAQVFYKTYREQIKSKKLVK